MANYPSDEQAVEMTKQVTQAQIEFWRHETLFHWQFWFLLVLLIIPWFIWYKLSDKKRFVSLGIFLLLYMILAITFDEVFTALSLRYYPHKLIPLLTRLTATDYSVVPILFTLAYQWFVPWKRFFGAITVMTMFISFVGEPLFKLLGLYVLIKWKYYYGFPVLLAMGLLSKWIVDTIMAVAQKESEMNQ